MDPSEGTSIPSKCQEVSKENEEASLQSATDPNEGSSILLKFQQLSKEKEEASLQSGSPKKNVLVETGNCAMETDDNSGEESKGEKRKASSDDEGDSDTLHKGLSEEDVGVTEFASPISGFEGIIKHRFSDFQVHEIDREGNVIILNSKAVPECDAKPPNNHKFAVLSDEQWQQIEENVKSNSKEPYEIDVTDKIKPERAALHQAIKQRFGPSVFSNTKEKDGKMILQIGKCLNNPDRRSWPAGRGAYLHFTVFKENMDSWQILNVLSSKLKIRPNIISFAGTKDKRGKTTQRMCIKQKTAEELLSIKMFKIKVGNFKYEKTPLRLGQLSGNQFEVAIRNIKASDDVINAALNSLNETGFLNYYGLQRFGSSPICPTYFIGKALISSEWKKAVELILMPKKGEKGNREVKKACRIWDRTKDAMKALKVIPKKNCCIETRILRGLKTHGPNDYLNALMVLPKNTLLMFVHSYQSLIWNKIVSKRVNKYGLKPIVGDLVEVKEEKLRSTLDSIHAEVEFFLGKRMKARAITEDELETVSIHDIIYPLPGYDVEYPKNEIAQWYEELLKEDDLTHECFKNTTRTFSLYGTYRKLLSKVEELSWEIVHYDDTDSDLILSDVDKMKGVTLKPLPAAGQYKGVILKFKLNSSVYATMLLREVMKCGTSSSYHASLTNADHNSQNKKAKPNPPEETA